MPFSGFAEVIESRRWVHPDGRTASVYGSKPFGEGWEIKPSGFDIYWTGDGTVGRCKPPFETKEEAEAYALDWNAKRQAALDAYAAEQAAKAPPVKRRRR
jgi:hypothetical protein